MTQQSEDHSALDRWFSEVGSRDLAVFLTLLLISSLPAMVSSDEAFGYPVDLKRQSTQRSRDVGSGTGDEKDVRRLELGKPIKRELESGHRHTYRIGLGTDQFLKITVEQQGIDVVVDVLGPDGKQILEFDSERRLQGQEEVLLAPEVAGEYRLTVQPKHMGAPDGSYDIRIEELRTATEIDRALYEARQLYAESLTLVRAGKYDEARHLRERALAIRERILGPDHSDVAAAINSLAIIYSIKNDNAKAEPLFQRALAIWEKALGPEHPRVAYALNNLGIFYKDNGEYTKAESFYRRTLAILEKALGPETIDVADCLNNLAELYRFRGEYATASPLYQRGIAIREKALGPEHPSNARAYDNLALLYHEMGDYESAETLFQRALSIRKGSLGPDHPEVADTLNNLAGLYSDRGEYAKAEPLFKRAMAIWEKTLGPEYPSVAIALSSLATLYRYRGEYAKAESLYNRSLSSWERVLGPEHPYLAYSLNSLGNLYFERGDYARAEMSYERALSIWEKTTGPEHPFITYTLKGLSALHAAKGDFARAIRFLARAIAYSERDLTLNLATGSERQKLAYLALFSKQTQFTLSLHSQIARDDPQALDLAFTTLLQRKGRGLDATANTIAALRRRAKPEDQALFDQLAEARSRLAALTLREWDMAKPETYLTRLKPLEEEVEKLEAELSSRNAEFRAQEQPATLAAVQAALPIGSALVEFAIFTPQDPRTEKSKPPRYLAYVLPAQGHPRWVDLGEASIIDKAIDAWRKALRDPNRTDVKRLARAVETKVMRPVRSLLAGVPGETRRLLIAPDGQLNLIPFAALVDERNRYLVERYAISHLTSGRDLLRLQRSRPSQNAPLVVANPIFGRVKTIAARTGKNSGNSQTGDQMWGEIDPTVVFFQSLPGTEREALAIKAVLPQASVLLRRQATETALKQAKAPGILHIATHGFFLSDQEAPLAEMRGVPGDDPLRVPIQLSKWAAKVENPLLRSGLALAGVNERRSGDDDGVLTAMEAASLDLWGTRLVVLSACDTGVGEVKNGEGVYGLRRALVLAGSETQVMSLWPVLDNKTGSLMTGYYRRLLKGEGRGEALRQIQLEMLKDAKLRHPHYWASFIQAGEWVNLDGQR
jgi:CHAT domain-containing protein/Tfp pilus assembly protein PilF